MSNKYILYLFYIPPTLLDMITIIFGGKLCA